MNWMILILAALLYCITLKYVLPFIMGAFVGWAIRRQSSLQFEASLRTSEPIGAVSHPAFDRHPAFAQAAAK